MSEGVPVMHSVTPILRIFDEQKAREFYVGFLEFRVDFEHRYEEDSPLYMGVSQNECVLHLSEHHGDACPGSTVRIRVDNIRAHHAKLIGKQYKYYRPGLEKTPWNTMEVTVQDPFGNKLVFYEPIGD